MSSSRRWARIAFGREFAPSDREASQPVAIVTRAFGRYVWHDDNVVGRRLKLGGAASPGPWMTIVGVADDITRYDLGEQPLPTMFVPYTQGPYSSMATVPFVVRANGVDARALAAVAREAVRGVDPSIPIAAVAPMEEVVERATADSRFALLLMSAFAAAALSLALAGLYGTVAFAVTTRTPELGMRMALGATAAHIVRLVMMEGLALLFGVGAHDVPTFAGAGCAVLVVAVCACAVPALRATRIDPRQAIGG
jgi:hypothetical protein